MKNLTAHSLLDSSLGFSFRWKPTLVKENQSEFPGEALIPLHSSLVTCGLFGVSEDYIENYLSLDERLIKNKASTFFFRASNDSMFPLILPRDLLVVDRSLEVIHRRLVVVSYEGGLICKRFLKTPIGPVLRSENSHYKDIHISPETELSFFGVVTAVIRETFEER